MVAAIQNRGHPGSTTKVPRCVSQKQRETFWDLLWRLLYSLIKIFYFCDVLRTHGPI